MNEICCVYDYVGKYIFCKHNKKKGERERLYIIRTISHGKNYWCAFDHSSLTGLFCQSECYMGSICACNTTQVYKSTYIDVGYAISNAFMQKKKTYVQLNSNFWLYLIGIWEPPRLPPKSYVKNIQNSSKWIGNLVLLDILCGKNRYLKRKMIASAFGGTPGANERKLEKRKRKKIPYSMSYGQNLGE